MGLLNLYLVILASPTARSNVVRQSKFRLARLPSKILVGRDVPAHVSETLRAGEEDTPLGRGNDLPSGVPRSLATSQSEIPAPQNDASHRPGPTPNPAAGTHRLLGIAARISTAPVT
jgi:hypothetical protein